MFEIHFSSAFLLSDRTVFLTPPEPIGLPAGVEYKYKEFGTLHSELFIQPMNQNSVQEKVKQVANYAPSSPLAKRTKHEVKSALKVVHVCIKDLFKLAFVDMLRVRCYADCRKQCHMKYILYQDEGCVDMYRGFPKAQNRGHCGFPSTSLLNFKVSVEPKLSYLKTMNLQQERYIYTLKVWKACL